MFYVFKMIFCSFVTILSAKETNPNDMRSIFYLMLSILIPVLTSAQPLKYPATATVKQEDIYHGIAISDPYRWLEDDRSEATKAWVKSQNEITFKYLENIPFRSKIHSRMNDLWNYPRLTAPWWSNGFYYYYRNTGMQNQNVLFRRQGLKGLEEMVLDPNFMSADGTTSLKFYSVSNNGNYAAYGISKAGSDWTEIKVLESKTGREMAETIKWVKFSGLAWLKDGFYYSRYDETLPGEEFAGKNEYHKVFFHKTGTPQSNDLLIFQDTKTPLRNFNASVSKDEQFLFISSSKASSGNDLRVRNLNEKDSTFKIIEEGFENSYSVIDNEGPQIFILTNDNAAYKKLISYDYNTGIIKAIIPEQKDVLLSVVRSGNKFIGHYMKDASSRLIIFSENGTQEKEISFPTYCTVSSLTGSKENNVVFYAISSFTFPETVYLYNSSTYEQIVYFTPEINFKAQDYETNQVFYKSKDGTKIPMFIVMKKGIILNGNNPLLLFGYGGFNISKTPEFITERLVFLENGGIFVMANIRGGGEYGKEWHVAGTKLQKQNVFDDFIAAAEFLINEKYTKPSKLAIGGRSNGGLLVGAVMTQRPELFKVALPAVGVMDMLRFHKFTIGWAWTNDFGSSDNKEQFFALKAYSPLHNLKQGINYPATFVTTADHDDRVVPAHSFKFISTLQEKDSGENPVLIRVDVNAGHGAGKPVTKLIEEQTDIFSFLMYNLGMELK